MNNELQANIKKALTLPESVKIKTILDMAGLNQDDVVNRSGKSCSIVSLVVRGKQRSLPVEVAVVELLRHQGAKITIEDLWTRPVRRRVAA